MALLAARRAAALLRPAAALLRPAARFSLRPDYGAFVASLRDISESVKADKNYFLAPAARAKADQKTAPAPAASARDQADSARAAAHDGEVLRVVDHAIRSQHRALIDAISSDFPFDIREKEGLAGITLTRSLKGEKIEVLVSMPKLDQYEEGDEDQSNPLPPSNENEEDIGKTPPEEYSLPVRVTVSKADGSGLVFTCTANRDDIDIKSLSIRHKLQGAEEDGMATYNECPDFCELDKNVQETIHKYLELRGVTPKTTKLLHEYIITKDRLVLPKTASKVNRNNLIFMTKLCNFVKKD